MTLNELFALPLGAVIAYDEMELLGIVFSVDLTARRMSIRWSDGQDEMINEDDPELDYYLTSFDRHVQ